MSVKPHIFKFGGASLRDAEAIRNTCSIIDSHQQEPLLVVVSALGKTTDALEKVVDHHANGEESALEVLNQIKQQHFTLVNELLGRNEELLSSLNDLFVEIDWVLEEPPHESYDFMYDQIVSMGELLSSRIVEAYLRHLKMDASWLDARDAVRTDNMYREGWVDWETTQKQIDQAVKPCLSPGKIIVTQGFIGSTSENFTTTLGRAGSDFTAAIFAHCLDAKAMTIWKDVPGMLTADPRYFRDVAKLPELSYEETVEMTYYGANIIHLKTIKPLQSKGIPLFVRSFLDPDAEGTRISDNEDIEYPPLIAMERNQAFLRLSTRDYSFVAEQHLRDIFQLICDLRLQVNLMQATGMYFYLCLNDAEDKIKRFVAGLEVTFDVSIDQKLEIITVRHPNLDLLENIQREREVLYVKQIPNTVQLVVRSRQ